MAELTFPEAEAAYVRQAYEKAEVILEYGSGGSTRLGAELHGKLIYSVESDRSWARNIQKEIDVANLPSPVILYPVDIGKTGRWGRPTSANLWPKFHRYPLAIWDEPFFRHPDLVLIDGRFRPACFAAVCLKMTSPVTILFDDYTDRLKYQGVEEICEPVETVGRMAKFELQPNSSNPQNILKLISMFSEVTYATQSHEDIMEHYSQPLVN